MTTSQSNDPLFIGIDLGGTTLKGALVTSEGEIIHEIRIDTEHKSPEALFSQVVESALALRNDDRAGGRVASIGMGIPGLVNRKTNRVEVMPNLPALTDIDIPAELSRETGLPVVLDNDANAAAYAELQVGAARGRRNVFFVTLGTGIGAGLIINGHVYRGAAGFAGEFGHMTIDPEGIECGCGNIGCLETIASGPNIVRRTRERLYRDRTSSLSRLAVPRDRLGLQDGIGRRNSGHEDQARIAAGFVRRFGHRVEYGDAIVQSFLSTLTRRHTGHDLRPVFEVASAVERSLAPGQALDAYARFFSKENRHARRLPKR